MDKTKKGQVIEEVRESFGRSSVGVVTHYRGLTVTEMVELRSKLRELGAEYRVSKNTLVKIAAKDTPFEGLSEYLTGPTAIALSADPVGPAKALTGFAKNNEKLVILGGVLDGKPISPDDIKALAALPSREELLSKLLGTMNGPAQGFVTALSQIPGGFVRCLDQIRQQKEEAA